MKPAYGAFEKAEHQERLMRARAVLKRSGIQCCVCIAPESHYYLAGYDTWVSGANPQALVFMVDGGEPSLVLRNVDVLLAEESSWVTDIRQYHIREEDPAEIIAAVAREKGLQGGRVGIELQSSALPHSFGIALTAALAPAAIIDVTELLGGLRLLKSDAELTYIREAAQYANAGLAAARRFLRPGITEIELAAEIEAAIRRAGSDYWAIPTELASGPRTAGGHAAPRARNIEPGDLVHVEFAGVAQRYHAVALHTMALGDPGGRAREIYGLAQESLRAGISAIRPDVPVADVEEASLQPLRKAGLEGNAMMRFGYGIGLAYPPIWMETLFISQGFNHRLQPGHVFVLHACLELIDEKIGVIQGGTYALTNSGLTMLVGGGDVPLDII